MSLEVEKLILSAILEILETWMKASSFKPLKYFDKEGMKNINMMTFGYLIVAEIHIQTRNKNPIKENR